MTSARYGRPGFRKDVLKRGFESAHLETICQLRNQSRRKATEISLLRSSLPTRWHAPVGWRSRATATVWYRTPLSYGRRCRRQRQCVNPRPATRRVAVNWAASLRAAGRTRGARPVRIGGPGAARVGPYLARILPMPAHLGVRGGCGEGNQHCCKPNRQDNGAVGRRVRRADRPLSHVRQSRYAAHGPQTVVGG